MGKRQGLGKAGREERSVQRRGQRRASGLHCRHSAPLVRPGIFTPRAEITNGRAAMLGFGILLLLEHKAGVPFF